MDSSHSVFYSFGSMSCFGLRSSEQTHRQDGRTTLDLATLEPPASSALPITAQQEEKDGVAAIAALVTLATTAIFSSFLIFRALEGEDMDFGKLAAILFATPLPSALLSIYNARISFDSTESQNSQRQLSEGICYHTGCLSAFGRKVQRLLPHCDDKADVRNRFLIVIGTVYSLLITWVTTALVNVNTPNGSLTPLSSRIATVVSAEVALLAISALTINKIFHQQRPLLPS